MACMILGLLAETSIHPGSGQDAGFVDLPVAREKATDYPVIVGSGFKGALLDRGRGEQMPVEELEKVFGKQDNAGALLVGDVRLVLLPVRSLTSHYKWVTCPYILERLERDLARAGAAGGAWANAAGPELGRYLGSDSGSLFLEERTFERQGVVPEQVIQLVQSLMTHQSTRTRVKDQLVILNDDDFVWFARYGLAINARNVLDEVTKTSKNLWYEETIPPDSLFSCLLSERGSGAIELVRSLLTSRPYIQVAGNETVGQGWFAVCERTGGAA